MWGIRKLWNSFKEEFVAETWSIFEEEMEDKGCLGEKEER